MIFLIIFLVSILISIASLIASTYLNTIKIIELEYEIKSLKKQLGEKK